MENDTPTLEKEILDQLEQEKESRKKLEATLADYQKKEQEAKLSVELEIKKAKDEKAVYEAELKKLTDEKFAGEFKAKYPDVDMTILKGSNDEKSAQAKDFQTKLDLSKEQHKQQLAIALGKAPIGSGAYGPTGGPSNPEEEKAKRL